MIDVAWISGTPCLRSVGEFKYWVFFALPLGDEANRMRRTAAQMMRHLTEKGWGCALPDISPYGENISIVPDIEYFSENDRWTSVIDALCPNPDLRCRASFRAGDQIAPQYPMRGHWRFSPSTPPLPGATAVHRTVVLTSDTDPADQRVNGPPVWRWAEPGEAPALTDVLARDLAQWIGQCVAS